MLRHRLMMILVVLVVGLNACVSDYVDPELEQSVQEYEDRYDTRIGFGVVLVDQIDVDVDDPDAEVPGNCRKTPFGREVQILRGWWESEEDPFYRQSLMFHELSHCQFDLEHDDSRSERGWKVSIMHSSPPDPLGEPDWTNLQDELEGKVMR